MLSEGCSLPLIISRITTASVCSRCRLKFPPGFPLCPGLNWVAFNASRAVGLIRLPMLSLRTPRSAGRAGGGQPENTMSFIFAFLMNSCSCDRPCFPIRSAAIADVNTLIRHIKRDVSGRRQQIASFSRYLAMAQRPPISSYRRSTVYWVPLAALPLVGEFLSLSKLFSMPSTAERFCAPDRLATARKSRLSTFGL